MTTRIVTVALLAIVLSACGADSPTVGPEAALVSIEGLGSLSVPNSGSAQAQEPFLRGVLLMHSFEFEPAAEAFRKAQEIDSGFALAYWGEAMTYNHPLWQQQDREAALEVLGRLAPTAAARAESAGTERERMYLAALDALYAEDGDKHERDFAYLAAMESLATAYPDDHEARAFWSLAILGSSDGVRDFATYMRAAATAQPVFDANPNHPGAAHYLIHSFDDPVHAPLGMQAARAYSEIAPYAAHAQHMTSHIFVATGLWNDLVSANIRARDVQDADRAERGLGPNTCGHYSSWLQYGHLMLGEVAAAEALMDACHEGILAGDASAEYFGTMRARQIIDTEDWGLAERWQADLPTESGFTGSSPRFLYDFTNALAAIRRGDPSPAREFVSANAETKLAAEAVQVVQLRGLLAIVDGLEREGLALLREAADTEDSMPFAFGPPNIVKPTFELLGEELLRAGQTEEAVRAFRRATERTPGRMAAEQGLASAR